MRRRQMLIGGGAFAIAELPVVAVVAAVQGQKSQSKMSKDGTPSIIEGGIVQFNYPDGTKIREYDEKTEIIRPNRRPEIKQKFPIEVIRVPQPAISSDETLTKWLDALAGDLRSTIRKLLRNDDLSNKNYDAWENSYGFTVYKKIAVRLKYINRLSKVE